ncbi:MAG: sigma-70 family RNA polymerase sigma factor [Chitinophaga sp.]|uniref:RNA polymerase sigma factor n=1 Tax=Chitinophaga sp. TaxID=1869181 RepID=UPI001B20E675|nr:sigma-70 family RNA polymerase sigma factor [Chitinophaga sp.]MBO9731557.1 sigma-70 family RNA polymerase sigma factor [Chitinophaga sp.]
MFEQWHPLLATHIYRVTQSRPLTEEIVQDVFLKIWNNRETLGDIRHFWSWLLVISRNHALNALQRKAREYKHWEQWVKDNATEANSIDPTHSFYTLIDEAIDQLSPRQKEIYLLHRHERMTYQQIAVHLNIGRETVKTHLESATRAISKHVKLQLAVTMTAIHLLL